MPSSPHWPICEACAQAYVILAWGHLWMAGVKDLEALESVAWSASNRLAECHDRSSRPDWSWFESRMTYANAVLPHALFTAAKRWPTEKFLDIATNSFLFLDRVTTQDDLFAPVGNQGWYAHGEDKALYDQQPSKPPRRPKRPWPLMTCWATNNSWPHSAAPGTGSLDRTACGSPWSMPAAAPALTACRPVVSIGIGALNQHSRICGASC